MKQLISIFLLLATFSAQAVDGYLAVTNGITVGGAAGGGGGGVTTITQTNFVLNTVYTNGSQAALLKASVSLTTASVNGQAAMNLMVDQAGGTTFTALSTNGITTTIAVSLAATDTRSMVGVVAASATYYWTNASSGSGDSAAIVAGTGQIVTISSGTNGVTGPQGTNIVNSGVIALTESGSAFATDASLGSYFRGTLTGNDTLSNPSNPSNGQKVIWELIQDGTGSRIITMGSKFAFGTNGGDITGITLSTTASARDFLTAVYNSTTDKWYVVGFVRGY